MDTPQNQYTNRRQRRPAIFLTSAGREYRRNVTVAKTNAAGDNFEQIPAGTVMGKWQADKLHYPIALDAAQSAVSGANDIVVDMVDQFRIGDFVELPDSVAKGADRFRKVTAVDRDNDTITLAGSAFSLAEGDAIAVDRTRSHDAVQDAGSTTSNTVTVSDATLFEVGDTLYIGGATGDLTVSIPDGTYTGEVGLTVAIMDDEGEELIALDARVQANSDTDDTIATAIKDQLDEQLSNFDEGSLGSASVTTGAPSTVTISLADPNYDFRYTYTDDDISATLTVTEDDSTAVEVTGVDGGNGELTLAKTLTFSNGEQIVSDPDGGYRITERTVNTSEMTHTPENVLAPTNDHGVVDESKVIGLTDRARQELEKHVRFTTA